MQKRTALSLLAFSICFLLSSPSEARKKIFPGLGGLMGQGRSCPPGGCPGTCEPGGCPPGVNCGSGGCPSPRSSGGSPRAPQALPFTPAARTVSNDTQRFIPGDGGTELAITPELTWKDGSETVRMNFSTGELFFIDSRTGQRRPLHAKQLKQVLANYQTWTSPPAHVTKALELYKPEREKWSLVAAKPATGSPTPKLSGTPVSHTGKVQGREEAPPPTAFEAAHTAFRKGTSSFEGLKSLDAHALTCISNDESQTPTQFQLSLKYEKGIKASLVPDGSEPKWEAIKSGNNYEDPWIVADSDTPPGTIGFGFQIRKVGKTFLAEFRDGRNTYYCKSTPAAKKAVEKEPTAKKAAPKPVAKLDTPSKFPAITEQQWLDAENLNKDWEHPSETQFTCASASNPSATSIYSIEIKDGRMRWNNGETITGTSVGHSPAFTASNGTSSIEIKKSGRKLVALVRPAENAETLYCAQNVEEDQTAAKQEVPPPADKNADEPRLDSLAGNPPKITVPATKTTNVEFQDSEQGLSTALAGTSEDLVLVKIGGSWCRKPCAQMRMTIEGAVASPNGFGTATDPIHIPVFSTTLAESINIFNIHKKSDAVPHVVLLKRRNGFWEPIDSTMGAQSASSVANRIRNARNSP